jgi:dCTP deaminase
LNLEKWRFYILATKEYFQVPLEYSLELLPSSHLIGEMRAHYAWFFDPGFGLDCPAQWVLEVRPFEDMIIYDWQPICLIKVFQNLKKPSHGYGKAKVANNYQGQSGAKLAKYFG